MKKFLLAILLPILITASAYAKVFVLTSPPAGVSNVPVVTNSGNTPTFTAGGAAIPGDAAVTLTCGCTTITGATVQITSGAFTNDALNFTNIFSITGSFAGTTMTLSGSDTVAHYQTALQSVTYSSINADPTNGGSNPTRTLSWIATSSAGSSNTGTSTLNVVLSTPAPTLSGGGNSVTYTSSGAAVAVDSGIGVSSSSNVTSATAQITSGLLTTDLLNFTNQFSITGSYNAGLGTLTLSGTDTAAHYQTAMASVTYSSTATDPTNAGADVSRTVTWQGFNSTTASNTVTSTVNVQNPAQPALSSTGNTVSYTSGGSVATLDNAIIVSCTCTTLSGATIAVTGGGTIAQQDILAATTTGTSITAAYNAVTQVITLSGTDTKANYQTVLRTIAYSSSATDATNSGVNPTRTFTWVASNLSSNSSPATTFANVFVGGTQPTWANTGAFVAFNPGTQQCWISGVGTGAISNCLQETRATQETCVNGATVTYAAPNVLCATTAGMQVLPAYTNIVTQSNNQANGAWIHFVTGSGTVATTANSAVSPDGNTTATKLVVQRTTTGGFGDNAQVVNNGFGLSAGANSFSIWLKADGVGDVGKVVNLYVLAGSASTISYTLTSTWTNVQFNNVNVANACLITSGNCQFGVGLSGSSSNNQTGTVNIDTWGAEVNAGPVALPTIATTTAAVNSAADNITALSPITSVMTSAASSILTSVSGAQASTVAEVLDSNGSAVLEENATNQLATVLGGTNTTSNTGTWTGTVTLGYARDGTGRSFGINHGVVVRDAAATTISVPLTFGASNTGTNVLTGNIGITNMYNIRIADSLIGVPGTGTKYYFAAGGNDANLCTITAPCQSITKANSLSIATNDQINFNGGDTFTGCLSYTGSSNWFATRTAPATIQSYGTGQAILTPNCTSSGGRIGIINFQNVDGVVVNNLKLVGDTAGHANIGVQFNNNAGTAHGNYTFQNSTCTGIHNATAFFGACIEIPLTGTAVMDTVNILNNTDAGASPTATDNTFAEVSPFANVCGLQNVIAQGNLIFNLGGNPNNSPGQEGTGIIFGGTCGLGSTPGGGTLAGANGLVGSISQFNVIHDNGANMGGAGGSCGNYYASWSSGSDSSVHRLNEVYNMLGTGAGCDRGAFDLDGAFAEGVANSMVERNYAHNTNGPCFISYNAQNSTFRWNICDTTGTGTNNGVAANSAVTMIGTATTWVYNNTIYQVPPTSTFISNRTSPIAYNGCPGVGSLFANNIVIDNDLSPGVVQKMFSIGTQNGTSQCTPAPIGNLTMANNDWWSLVASFTFGATLNNSSYAAPTGMSGGNYAAFAALVGETNGKSVNPQFTGTIGANVTCNTTAGTSGPQATGCPAGYTLGSGSPMAAPAGATLTSAPYNLPTTIGGIANKYNGQGTLSYYGTALPCAVSGGTSGYPIGADCGSSAAPPPSFSLSFTSGTLPSCSGCNVAFSGGAGTSWYDASNVLHFNNAANTPRFDHNPSNGTALGILIEPAKTNNWAASTPTAGNTNTNDNDHAQLTALCCGTNQQTTAWVGVWGNMAAGQKTGPDNAANSAATFTEDTCTYPTSVTCAGNAGDGGHASANSILPGTNPPTPFSATNQNVIVSEYIRNNNDSGDALRGLTFYAPATGGADCYANYNVAAGTVGSPTFAASSGFSCSNSIIQTINISGNVWHRVMYIEGAQASVERINSSATVSGTNTSTTYTGDGHSGFMIYGAQITPIGSITAICTPGVSGTVPCTANSYINNSNVYSPVTTVADNLSFTVPAGLCALTYTFDDNSTQKITLGGSCATASTNVTVPTNLNRPWIQTIVGSAS